MDKYEYRVSLNEINSLVEEKRFEEAAQIADTIDWRKVRSKDTLCRISDIYKIIKDYERARDILDLANQRNPHVPEIIYSLCELTIFLYGQTGSQSDLAKAIGLKQEYQSEYPDDPKRLILEYKFYKVSPVTVTEKIATLEQLRDEDHSPRWGYELATLYREAGMNELAADECKQICRQFGGRFADRAATLAQELKADARAAAESADEALPDRDEEPRRRAMDEAPDENRSERVAENRSARESADLESEPRRAAVYEEAESVRREADALVDEASEREADRFRVASHGAAEEPADRMAGPERRHAAIDDDVRSGDTGISGIRRKPYREPSAAEEHESETGATSPYSEADHVQERDMTDREPSQSITIADGTEDTVDGVRRFERIVREEPAGEPETGSAAGPDDQLSVGQVYDEWERIRRDIRKRNDEKRAQRIMEDTGPLLQDFDETARHGLIEAIEKDAARQRRQVRSGAASILGNGGYGDSYGRVSNDRYGDPYGDGRGGNRYNDSYNQGQDDRRDYNEPADDRYDDRYAQEPAEELYNDRYGDPRAIPYDEQPRRRGESVDRYEEPAEDQYDDRYDDRRPVYEPLPEPEDSYQEREYIQAETVREDPLPTGYEGEQNPYEEIPRHSSVRIASDEPDAAEGDVRGKINDHESFERVSDAAGTVGAGVAAGAVGAAAGFAAGTTVGAMRGSRFNAAMHTADAAMDIAHDAANDAAEDDDIATRRWNSEEVRKAMEAQKARIAEAEAAAEAEARRKAAEEEAARLAAEEEARRQAEEEARRKAAEELAAERARIEAEIRAEYEAKERARIEAEEEARRQAEEEAARLAAEEEARRQAEAEAARRAEQERAEAEAKARAEAEAMARMRAEIEAQIRAEYAEREQARIAALGITSETIPASAPQAESVVSSPVTATAPLTYAAEADETATPVELSHEMRAESDDDYESAEPLYEPEPVEPTLSADEDEDIPAEESVSEETFPEDEIPADAFPAHEIPDDVNEALPETIEDDESLPEMDEAPAEEPVAPRMGRRRPRRGRTIDDDLAQPADMETAEIPASAASSIAAAAEKPPSEEELKLFGPFYRMKENRDQVTAALDKISLASYTGNIIITGNAVTARRVAQGLLELTREADSNFTGKIAKATGSALNKLTEDRLRGILKKIENGALIIEHASVMDETAVQNLYNELENRDRGVIVVMMDARKPLDTFLAQYSSQMGSFTARVDIRPLNDKALVDYGKDYANMRDYSLDELAELALSSRISSMQSPNHRVTLKEVRDIIDEAISYASRKTPQMLMSRISGKRYDADDRIILREKDFQHLK